MQLIASYLDTLSCDWDANKGNAKGRMVLLLFRIANVCVSNKVMFVVFFPYLVFYRLFVEWLLGIELPPRLMVGYGLRLYHGQSLVVNNRAIIGKRCILRNSVTIGVKITSPDFNGGAPIIGDDVDIGAGAIIIGPITIGSGAIVGAGAVIVKNVPENAVVVGNPGKVIKYARNNAESERIQ